MSHKPESPQVKNGWWRHRDGSKEYGIRIWTGQRHIFIGIDNATTVADAIIDIAESIERKQTNDQH